jgi:hypothetical protein
MLCEFRRVVSFAKAPARQGIDGKWRLKPPCEARVWKKFSSEFSV